eukprot:TRINITY_DN13067_c0_g1_i2.p1 TRINITY_DN13067_c0_g1~~TRINITY_DN13067_c0_g1_i2.p1  ORF type:complete len:155 (+),score=54.61 TRINITY_DN13067_c0_g1_i2:61-465(+)
MCIRDRSTWDNLFDLRTYSAFISRVNFTNLIAEGAVVALEAEGTSTFLIQDCLFENNTGQEEATDLYLNTHVSAYQDKTYDVKFIQSISQMPKDLSKVRGIFNTTFRNSRNTNGAGAVFIDSSSSVQMLSLIHI